MKKVLFVLAFVAVYGVSMAMTSNTQVVSPDQTVTIVADVDNNIDTPEGEKEKKAAKTEAKAETKSESKSEGCSGTKAKSEGCAGEKSAEKKGCGSSCGGKK
jgi:hypothetical protein